MNPILSATLNLGSSAPGFIASLAVTTLIQYLIYGGAILFVAGGVAIWAAVIRKPHKHRHHHHRDRPARRDSTAPANNKTAGAADPAARRRRRRRSEPPRNPTLAETRGLPPIRGEQSAATGPYPH